MGLSTNLKHSFRTRNVIASCPLYGLSNGQSQSFEGGFRPEVFFRHELKNGKCISRTDDDRFPHAEHRRAK